MEPCFPNCPSNYLQNQPSLSNCPFNYLQRQPFFPNCPFTHLQKQPFLPNCYLPIYQIKLHPLSSLNSRPSLPSPTRPKQGIHTLPSSPISPTEKKVAEKSSNEAMESGPVPTVAKRLWHIVRAVFFMLRKGVAKRKLMVDLHLLLQRGKLAGKALGHLISFQHHHHHHQSAANDRSSSAFSCRSLDRDALFHSPKGVQLSCSNTPSYDFFFSHAPGKRRSRRGKSSCGGYDAVAVALAIDLLDREGFDSESAASSALPTPSPMLLIGRSPAGRPLRITDSPFPAPEEEAADGGGIDREADEFIKRFYEQLQRQQLALAAATPEHAGRRRRPAAFDRA